MRTLITCTMGMLLLAACATTPTAKRTYPYLEQTEPGVFVVPPDGADRLLELKQTPDVRMLVLPTDFKGISDAHVAALRDWVVAGGTAWIETPALANPSLTQLVKFQYEPFEFHKTSTGEPGGELVVRDAVDRLKIHDHPLTEGVRQLYVYPRVRFDGTPDLVPLLEMTDLKGAHGTVIGVVNLGSGRVILDGTARDSGSLLGRLPGFNPEHPNAVQQGEQWNTYDWNRLIVNARELSEPSTSGSSGR